MRIKVVRVIRDRRITSLRVRRWLPSCITKWKRKKRKYIQIICNEYLMMIANLEFLTRILMTFHIKSTNQGLCNGLVIILNRVLRLSCYSEWEI